MALQSPVELETQITAKSEPGVCTANEDIWIGALHMLRGLSNLDSPLNLKSGPHELSISPKTSDTALTEFARGFSGSKHTQSGRDSKQAASGDMMVAPFKLNVQTGQLISANGFALTLPNSLSYVLESMLQKHPHHPESYRSELNYEEVSQRFREGWAEDRRAKLHQMGKVSALQALKKKQLGYHAFSQRLAKILSNNGILPKEIFSCDRRSKSFRLGPGWHRKKALVGRSEATVFFGQEIE